MDNKEAFKKALAFVLLSEGGYVNDPADSGGKTYKGITQGVYNTYRANKKLPHQEIGDEYPAGKAPKGGKVVRWKGLDVVIHITDQEVEDIYYNNYWKVCKCDTMTPQMGAVVFDTAVNMGIGKPSQYFKELGYSISVDKFLARREQSYRAYAQNPTQTKFLNGWLNRIANLKKFISTLK